jgi:23S rRNA G2445 N2-methylase RlmL
MYPAIMVNDGMINVGVMVNKGFEKAAVVQVREILENESFKEIHVGDTLVSFKSKEWDHVYRFIYKNQIANRVLYLVDEFDYRVDDVDELLLSEDFISEIRKHVESIDDAFLKELILNGADFRVSMNIDEHTDVTGTEAEIGGVLIDHAKTLGKDLKVNLKNPIMNFHVYIHNSRVYLGIDLSGDLSKRDYKIFNNAVSLKGPTAFGLLMLVGYNPKDVYLNPCCYSGIIEIEAALYSTRTSHRFYDKSFPFMKLSQIIGGTNDDYFDKFFKKIDDEIIEGKKFPIFPITGSDKLLSSITAATKNAKVAGMESVIDFRRIDLDWMDIKFEEKTIDKIVSFIPGSSKHDKNLLKDFKQLFYQAEYILKDSGKLVIMCLSKDLLIQSSSEYFGVDHELMVHSGAQAMHVLFFKRKSGKSSDESPDKGG